MNQILLHGITMDELLLAIGKLIDEKLEVKQRQLIREKEGYITRKEVADLLKVSLATLNDYTKLGWLISYKVGNRVLYKESEVRDRIEKLATMKHKKFLNSASMG
jgi:excisionase family DNA binding protein